jgi:hypothetical protein
MAEKLFDYFASEGYVVSMAGAEINTGTEGSINSKQLIIFKPEKEQKYNDVHEAYIDIDNILTEFAGQPCTFDIGCDIVSAIHEQTLLSTDDWGVYKEDNNGHVTIYNNDSEAVIQLLIGVDSGNIVANKVSMTTLQEMIGL